MLVVNRLLALILGALGLALMVYGVWGGVWPISVQLIAGVALVAYATVRWRYYCRPRSSSSPRAGRAPRA